MDYRVMIRNLSNDYEISIDVLEKIAKILLLFPFIKNGDIVDFYTCFEYISSDLATNDFYKANTNSSEKSLSNIISDAINRTYGDVSYYFLNDFFFDYHGVNLNQLLKPATDDNNVDYSDMSDEEKKYNGFKI